MAKTPLATEESRPATFGWLQVEKKVGQALQMLAIKHPSAMGTLFYLLNNMGRSNTLAVSQQVIADKLQITRGAVNNAVKVLTKHNFIEIVKVGNLCVYRVNTRVAWQGHRGERYAHFHADVIAVEKEQSSISEDPLMAVPVPDDDERILIGNEEIDPPDQGELTLP